MDIPQVLLEELELQCSPSWSNPMFQRCSMRGYGVQMLILGGLSLQNVPLVQGREGTTGHGEPLSWGQLWPSHLSFFPKKTGDSLH